MREQASVGFAEGSPLTFWEDPEGGLAGTGLLLLMPGPGTPVSSEWVPWIGAGPVGSWSRVCSEHRWWCRARGGHGRLPAGPMGLASHSGPCILAGRWACSSLPGGLYTWSAVTAGLCLEQVGGGGTVFFPDVSLASAAWRPLLLVENGCQPGGGRKEEF